MNASLIFATSLAPLGRALLVAAALSLTAARPAWPQAGAFLMEVEPTKVVAAAFEQPYGRALLAEFVRVVNESVDPECLQQKGVTKDQLSERARAILLQRGIYLLQNVMATIDRDAFKRLFGAHNVAALERLGNHPKVRAYSAAVEPAQLAYIATFIVENVERYAVLRRIRLRGISPASTGNLDLAALDPTDTVMADLEKMTAADRSGTLSRYRKLMDAAREPMRDAIGSKAAGALGPGELLAGPDKDTAAFYNELMELCVAPR